jgi:isopenicillin-N N-acyltransferase-like protein
MNKADQFSKHPIHSEPIPLVKVKGNHRQIGQQIGEAFRQQVQHSLASALQTIDNSYNMLELTWDGAKIQSKKYMPFAQELFPQYVEEMIGIAEGAAVDFEDIAVLNAMEAVTTDALHLTKCTSFALNGEMTSDGHVLVAHNEDWLPEDEDDVYLVHAEPDDEPPFLAMTYGGLIPNIGFNAYGVAQCCDSVYPNDSRIGVPRLVVSRAVLSRKILGDAIRTALTPRRAAGYNHLIAHESGELYNVEVSSRNFSIRYAEDNFLVHTNHYLSHNMSLLEADSDELINTRVRYFRAERLIKETAMHNIRTIQDIQRDHINHPSSICNHSDTEVDPLDREKTINSMVIDLTARVMHIAWGNPCANKYHTYYLDA